MKARTVASRIWITVVSLAVLTAVHILAWFCLGDGVAVLSPLVTTLIGLVAYGAGLCYWIVIAWRWASMLTAERGHCVLGLVLMACFAGAFFTGGAPACHLGIRYRVGSGALPCIRQWASAFCRRPDSAGYRWYRGDAAAFPDCVRRLRPEFVIGSEYGVQGSAGSRPGAACVVIAWGGGFLHWGLKVQGPGVRSLAAKPTPGVLAWRDGVYTFIE